MLHVERLCVHDVKLLSLDSDLPTEERDVLVLLSELNDPRKMLGVT